MKHSRAGYASYAGTPESAGGSWLSGFAGRTRRCRASATPRHLRPTPTFGHGAGRAELTTRRRTSSAANRQSADAHIQWKRLQRGGLRHVWRGEGGHPLVSTADAPATHAANEPQQQTRRAGSALSHGCGTRRTADADASAHPGSPHPSRSTHVGTAGSGQPRSPHDRTAHTTGSRTGTHDGCAATASCTPRHHVTHGPGSPHAHERHSGHHEQSARAIRVPSTGGGVYAAWGSKLLHRHP